MSANPRSTLGELCDAQCAEPGIRAGVLCRHASFRAIRHQDERRKDGAMCSASCVRHSRESRSLSSVVSNRFTDRPRPTSHSHTVKTRQPSALSSRVFRTSRSTFVENLFFQNCALFVGIVVLSQLWWRCQKQPCTKTTIRYFGNTISGFPGRSLRCRLNRYPRVCKAERTAISGTVSRPRMRDMFQLLRSGDSRSFVMALTLDANGA